MGFKAFRAYRAYRPYRACRAYRVRGLGFIGLIGCKGFGVRGLLRALGLSFLVEGRGGLVSSYFVDFCRLRSAITPTRTPFRVLTKSTYYPLTTLQAEAMASEI